MKKTLKNEDAMTQIIAPPHSGEIETANGNMLKVDESFLTAASVLFDAFFVPGGQQSVEALRKNEKAQNCLKEGYKHCKAIATAGEGSDFVAETLSIEKEKLPAGVLSDATPPQAFVDAIKQHRFWERESQ